MKKSYKVYFIIVFATAVLAYLGLAFSNTVWYDEAYTMAMVKHGFADICSITAQDVHPPLYYILLKIFAAPFGYSIFAAKIFSVIPLLLLIALGYVKLTEFFDRKTGFLFALMTAFLPIMTTYAVELRMYGWAALFVTGCALYAYGAYKDEDSTDYFIFTMFGVLAAYTHYFALVSAGIVYIILLIGCIRKKQFKKFILSCAATVVLYLPWLTAFISQLAEKVTNEYWIAPITVKTVLNYFTVWFACGNYTGAFVWLVIVAIAGAVAFIILDGNKTQKIAVICAVAVFIMTNVVGIIASAAVRPVFIERYAVPSLPLLLMSVAIGIGLSTKTVLTMVIVIFTGGFILNYPVAIDNEYNAAEEHIEWCLDDADYEALICYVDSHLYGVLSHYADDAPVYRPKLSKGSPFENIHALSSFDAQNCQWAALFVPAGNGIPQDLPGHFNAEYVRTISTYGIDCDMYNLWK